MSGECHYCGANDWVAFDNDAVLCAECLSPESLLALTAAEEARHRKRFTEGREPDEYETPEYYDRVWAARRVANRPDGEPFWRTPGR